MTQQSKMTGTEKNFAKQGQKNAIQRIIENEFVFAVKNHPRHNSAHESYAIALEEFEEMTEELVAVKAKMNELWESVKNDNQGNKQDDIIYELHDLNFKLITEAIQFSAMIVRFRSDILNPF